MERLYSENLRSEIKHNFLKKMIFRLDYEGIMEADIEQCVLDLRQSFFDAGFVDMERRTENEEDMQLKMELNISDANRFSVRDTGKSSVYRFSSNNKEVLELNKSFFTLTVDVDEAYERFDKYIAVLAKTVDTIKHISPYFRALRMGLRKINICFLKDLRSLSDYFTKAAFNIGDIAEQFSDSQCTASNIVTILLKEGYQVNYVRNLQEGVMQQESGVQQTVYQVVLDVDVYKEDNREILPLLADEDGIKNTLIQQNMIEFEVFIKSLSDRFVELLQKDTFESDEIKGVN